MWVGLPRCLQKLKADLKKQKKEKNLHLLLLLKVSSCFKETSKTNPGLQYFNSSGKKFNTDWDLSSIWLHGTFLQKVPDSQSTAALLTRWKQSHNYHEGFHLQNQSPWNSGFSISYYYVLLSCCCWYDGSRKFKFFFFYSFSYSMQFYWTDKKNKT